MADPKKNIAAPDARAGADNGSKAANASAGAVAAYEEYVKALQAAYSRAHQQCSDAQTESARAICDAQHDGRRSQEDALRAYAASLQDACGQEGAARAVREAEQKLADALDKVRATVRTKTQEAERKAADLVHAANEQANKSWQEARLAYIKKIQEHVAKLDPQSLPAESLALIGQSLVAASYAACATHQQH